MSISQKQARLLLELYRHDGFLHWRTLTDVIEAPGNAGAIQTMVYRINRRHGTVIESRRDSNGGYRLSALGRSLIGRDPL